MDSLLIIWKIQWEDDVLFWLLPIGRELINGLFILATWLIYLYISFIVWTTTVIVTALVINGLSRSARFLPGNITLAMASTDCMKPKKNVMHVIMLDLMNELSWFEKGINVTSLVDQQISSETVGKIFLLLCACDKLATSLLLNHSLFRDAGRGGKLPLLFAGNFVETTSYHFLSTRSRHQIGF